MVLLHNLQLSSLYKNVLLEASVYENNGNTVLTAHDADTLDPITTLTVNVMDLPNYLVTIKNWAENEGVLEWLVENNVIELDENYDVETGFVTAQGARLINDELYEQALKMYQGWKNDHLEIHLLDEHGDPLLEDDGETPVIVELEPKVFRHLDELAAEQDISIEDLFLQLLDKTLKKEQTDQSEEEAEQSADDK